MSFKVRNICEADLPSIALVRERATRARDGISGEISPEFLAGCVAIWARIATLERVQVVTTPSGQIVGVSSFSGILNRMPIPSRASVHAQTGYVSQVYVDPDYWRRGVGEMLLRAAMCQLRAIGRIRVVAEVVEGNDASVAFLRSLGYTQYGRHTEGLPGLSVNLLMFEASL